VLFVLAVMKMPSRLLPRSVSPAGFVPMKQPSTVLPPTVRSVMPFCEKRLMARPRTVEPPAVMRMPLALPPALVPSSSMRRTASLPAASVFAFAPGCV
jgi:hypothetical protein